MATSVAPVDFGRYVITDTAGNLYSFAAGDSPTSLPSGSQCFKGRIETASLRIRGDSVNPSSTTGELLDPGEDLLLDEAMLSQFRFVRDGLTNAVIQGHFYNVRANILLGGGGS